MFEPHPEASRRKRSAIVLAKCLLSEKNPDVLPAHRRELLRIILYKMTEADSAKYETRFRTQPAMDCRDRSSLIHEHVFQRKKMIAILEQAAPEEIEEILQSSVGCIVTNEEHDKLQSFDDDYGWDRYRKAGLIVIDTQTGQRLI